MLPYQNLSLEDISGEVWKDVKGFNGIYQVSSLGRIKAIRYKHKIRVQHISRDGYAKITFCVGSKYTYFNVHRLVALAFLPPVEHISSYEVDHIDGVKLNNSYKNLRWVNHEDNMRNPRTTIVLKKRKGPLLGKKGKLHPRSKPIFAMDKDGNRFDFEGSWDAHRKGYKYTSVQACLHNKMKTYRGLRWFFTEIPPRKSVHSSTCNQRQSGRKPW